MNFIEAIEKCKPQMYYVFRKYSIDDYDNDDLFQETILWILRDWEQIVALDNCEIETAIINRAKWMCNHLATRNKPPRTVPFEDEDVVIHSTGLNEYDMIRLMIKAKKRLSDTAFEVFMTKLDFGREAPTRREVQKTVGITYRPYSTVLKEIRDFLHAEGICPDHR